MKSGWSESWDQQHSGNSQSYGQFRDPSRSIDPEQIDRRLSLHEEGPSHSMAIYSSNSLCSSLKRLTDISLSNHAWGKGEYSDISRVVWYRVLVDTDTPGSQVPSWPPHISVGMYKARLRVGPPGSKDPPGSIIWTFIAVGSLYIGSLTCREILKLCPTPTPQLR